VRSRVVPFCFGVKALSARTHQNRPIESINVLETTPSPKGHGMNLLFTCETCGVDVDEDNIGCVENNWCDWCMEQWCQEQIKQWKPSWLAEKVYRDSLKLAQEYDDDPHQTRLVR
jgi:hypothetical protein